MALTLATLRWCIGAVFLVAMLMKLRRSTWPDFVATVRALLGTATPVLPIAVSLTVAEAACAVLLATHAVAGFALALALLVTMTGAIVIAVRRKVEVSCPCFGASTARLGVRHALRNCVLAAAALTGLLLAFGGSSRHLPASGTAIAAVAGMLAAGVIARLDDIIDLFAGRTSTTIANRSSL